MNALEVCTTNARKKKHLSDDLNADRWHPGRAGRRGRTLCGNYGFDQRRYDADRWWRLSWRELDISTLPACRQCDKSARAFNRALPDGWLS